MDTKASNKSVIAKADHERAAGGKFVYVAAAFAGLGGLLFGYDTGVISSAELFLKQEFALSAFALEVIVSGVLAGAAIGALVGGRLADLFGRRTLLIATSIIFAAGALVCAVAGSPAILIVGRFVAGCGIGLSSSTVPVYISEVSPPASRGWTVSLFQLAITVGILLAYLIGYVLAPTGGWRWMFGLAVIPSAIFCLGMIFLPESPRWLVKQGETGRARGILQKIRGTREFETELAEIESSLKLTTEQGRLSDLLQPSLRAALIVGLGLAVFQQVTGINTVIYYAPIILQSAGIPTASGAILATAGIGLVNVLMTVVSMWLIDRVGRRPLLLVGIAGMVVTLSILAVSFRASAGTGALSWLAVISIMLYVASFAISLGPIFWLLISEIYPLRVRNSAEGLSAAFNWGSNLVVSLTFLTLLGKFGTSATFGLYALLAVGAWIFSYYRVPETKGRTLEAIEAFWRT